MRTSSPENNNQDSADWYEAIFRAASHLADKLDPDCERETISFEPYVYEALDQLEESTGSTTVKFVDVCRLSLQLARADRDEDQVLAEIARTSTDQTDALQRAFAAGAAAEAKKMEVK